MHKIVAALLLCLCSANALAERLYKVELLLFRQGPQSTELSKIAPDDWAGTALPIAGTESPTSLNQEASKLTQANGYQVLLHQAWSQASNSRSALTSGAYQMGHYPVAGTVHLSGNELPGINAEFWLNHFAESGVLAGSEQFKVSQALKDNTLTYFDHGSLGALVRITAQ